MVNTGKPSGGCKLCRARRVKCDETKPFCLKCLKYGRQCPGYRDPFEVKIRDETQTTIRRLQRKPRGQASQDYIVTRIHNYNSAYDPVVSGSQYGCGPPALYDPGTPVLGRPRREGDSERVSKEDEGADGLECFLSRLSYPVEEQATCFFLSDFIMLPNGPGSRGYHNFVHSILKKGGLTVGFRSAFKAVAMAALSSRPGSQLLLTDAQVWYSRALRDVNRALQDPTLVEQDQTLAAVLLLAFYEVLAPRAQLTEYINHMRGAAAIVRLRGPPQAGITAEVAEMYALTRNQLFTLYAMPIESYLDGRDYEFLATTVPGTPAWPDRVAVLNIACTKLRATTDMLLRRWPRPPKRRRRRRIGTPEEEAGSKEADAVESAFAQRLLDRGIALLVEVGKFLQASPPPCKAELMPVCQWTAMSGIPGQDDGASEAFPGQGSSPAGVYRWSTFHSAILTVITWTTHLLATTSVLRLASAIVRANQAREMNEADEKCKAEEGQDCGCAETSLPSPAPSAHSDLDERIGMKHEVRYDEYRNHPSFKIAQEVAQARLADLIASVPFFCTWAGTREGGNQMLHQNLGMTGGAAMIPPQSTPVNPQVLPPPPQGPLGPGQAPPHQFPMSLTTGSPAIFPCGTSEGYIKPAPNRPLNGPRGAAPVKGLSGKMIMWPIFAAKVSEFCTPAQHDYLQRRLEWLRDVVGIRQARILLMMDDIKSPATEIQRDMARMQW